MMNTARKQNVGVVPVFSTLPILGMTFGGAAAGFLGPTHTTETAIIAGILLIVAIGWVVVTRGRSGSAVRLEEPLMLSGIALGLGLVTYVGGNKSASAVNAAFNFSLMAIVVYFSADRARLRKARNEQTAG